MDDRFKGLYIDYVPRKKNIHTDTLASLETTLVLPTKVGQKIFVASPNLYYPKHALKIRKTSNENKKDAEIHEVLISMEP